ncbi:anthranilate phosphoribosyltransferase [Cohnella caldifontis]|uniref:anthranilate phosphoribosyltransferase n=1 Tax=Cohnella caldifontis TaxID=3027471 RepID=UPI0023EDB192|nr:anthranilate phosphoribosyltransferase [Cohnella sp. YIM B05605]
MIQLLKEVGRGKRGARDLTYEEALSAAGKILSREATPAQIGAFLIAERVKMESAEEIEAFAAVCRQAAYRTSAHQGLDCAGPYDGRKKSFMATFPAAFLLAAAGLPVTLHGAPSLPPKWGITLHDLMLAAGFDPSRAGKEAALRAAARAGVLYVDAETWCPPLKELRPIREELGMRTVFNTAEKLVDYAHSPFLAIGVYHNTVFDRTSRLLTKLGYRKALIVQGEEGSEDLHVDRPTRCYLVENGEARLQVIDPDAYGLDAEAPETEWTPVKQLQAAEDVLRGQGPLAYIYQTALNAAVRLHLADRAGSVEEGLYQCKAILESGGAWNRYARWKEVLLRG